MILNPYKKKLIQYTYMILSFIKSIKFKYFLLKNILCILTVKVLLDSLFLFTIFIKTYLLFIYED